MKKIILLLPFLCLIYSALFAQCPDHNALSNKSGSQFVMNWKPTAAGEKEAIKYAAAISHVSLVSETTGAEVTSEMTLKSVDHKGAILKRRLVSEVKDKGTFKKPFSGTVTLHMKDGTSCKCAYKKRKFVSNAAAKNVAKKSGANKGIVQKNTTKKGITKKNTTKEAVVQKNVAQKNTPSNTSRPKPNIVLILADDLGWQDVGCYDIDAPAPYETPNMDALAKEGIQFWQGYSPAPTCAPSRCAIMSGNHPARAQKTHVKGGTPPAPNNKTGWPLMSPWYSGRMPANELTVAKVLQQNGYKTGHSGKWHIAISHSAFPQPKDVGFDYTMSNRGKTKQAKPNRLGGFSTTNPSDPFPIDENGFVFHQPTEDALDFMRQEKENPFFLYYAEWLVHTPIHTRNKRLLEKYLDKLGIDYPTEPTGWIKDGQNNPFYCAMVEALDYHVGQIVNYLEETDDPRWPGHKLVDNTYIIFTSDNGGMEGGHGEVITDNYPLDRGKISAMEGGTRVPLLIAGPDIKKGVQSDVMVNGLDFYPTILSLTETPVPVGKNLDGLDISTLLTQDPTNSQLVKDKDGQPRTTMMWHFPNSVALESTIRVGDYKLIRNYNHEEDAKTVPLELYKLYDTKNGKSTRVDIEEANNLVATKPKLAQKLDQQLTEVLTEMKASYPYRNPHYNKTKIPHKEKVPVVKDSKKEGNTVTFVFKENGAKVIKANLFYTQNGGAKHEEWFRMPATLISNSTASAILPKGTTHYLINLIDENNFLVSYPDLLGLAKYSKKRKFSQDALAVK